MTLLHNYNVSSKTKLNKIIRIEKERREREREVCRERYEFLIKKVTTAGQVKLTG